MKFNTDDLREIVFGGSVDKYEMIEWPKLIDNSRWSLTHEFIFSYEGKFYRGYYTTGATEQQDHCAFEYDDNPMECDEVIPVEKTIIVYEKVK